ncbi:MAG: hypothetical protein WKF75_05425 [Singulisphaera sp.]
MIGPRPGALPLLLASFLLSLAAAPAPTPVEPSELAGRADLVGREVAVDDRVAYFQFHKGRGFDELVLKRTPVVFRIPPALRPKQSPKAPAVRVRGILRHEGNRWACDVSGLELFPADRERFDRGVSELPPGDAEGRRAWARWAERRGREFGDAELKERAQLLEGKALRIESERRSTDPRTELLELARQARSRNVPEPEPSSLAHRAFQAQLAAAETVEELKALRDRIETFLPDARTPRGGDGVLAKWEAPYANDPAGAYRSAPEEVRAALDRRLWADTTQRLLEVQMRGEPKNTLALAEEAGSRLPDRPAVVAGFFEQALVAATNDLGALRRGEVEKLATLYREKLGKPDEARTLSRRWLDDQRLRRLSPTDAEGRVSLAGQYELMLGDRATAAELLRSAWKIDPQSKDVADAFRRRGFRKVNDDWVEPSRTVARADVDPANGPQPAPAGTRSESLRGSSPQEVRVRLGGQPNRKVFSATQGQLLEQWIYYGAKENQYINFLHRPGSPLPRVVAYYSRPRSSEDPAPPQ